MKKRRYGQFNSKRRIRQLTEDDLQHYGHMAEEISYGGNPEHKKNPGDFGLTPPSSPRPGKSLCDTVRIFSRQVALERLQAGLLRGLVSERSNGKWPQNIWSVTEDGHPLEAQLENSATGAYHGYPMPQSDPLATEVISQWKIRDEIINQLEERDD
ncbi:hypothetical protein QUF72_17710 [Desulfobacterales bacterium HSG2]|nr:hypothetical protein [Desulfobacterales bacterium HSG2]